MVFHIIAHKVPPLQQQRPLIPPLLSLGGRGIIYQGGDKPRHYLMERARVR